MTEWDSTDVDHYVFLASAIATHAVVGYALVRVFTSAPPALGIFAGVAPDVDLLFAPTWEFPLVHRGLTHTPLLLGVALGGLLLLDVYGNTVLPDDAVVGAGIAVLSHLVIDSFTNAGIMWLYPLSVRHFAYDLSIHSFAGTLLLWGVAAGLVYRGDRDWLRRRGV